MIMTTISLKAFPIACLLKMGFLVPSSSMAEKNLKTAEAQYSSARPPSSGLVQISRHGHGGTENSLHFFLILNFRTDE
ncbi:unnamed protein product [Citrullus colocynthis]|uniref:Secreted protein n=1 Tax=Citrullus colocynthis TaxID=252529 RepID=A0ABP0YEE7_9ROSI